MALRKVIEEGPVTVLPNGILEVRTETVIYEDETEIGRTFHRATFDPAVHRKDDLTGHARELADAFWTSDRVAQRQAQWQQRIASLKARDPRA